MEEVGAAPGPWKQPENGKSEEMVVVSAICHDPLKVGWYEGRVGAITKCRELQSIG
jgi:hypothetical protein